MSKCKFFSFYVTDVFNYRYLTIAIFAAVQATVRLTHFIHLDTMQQYIISCVYT